MAEQAQGELREIADPQAPLRREPSPDAALDTEALKGERVFVAETTAEGWSRGRLAADGYVGWIPSAALRKPGLEATHKVTALRTLVFPGPSLKLPPVEALSLGSQVAVTRIETSFAVTTDGGYVPARHIAPVGVHESDWVAVAERFVGVPYLWGGKTSLGIDCSGLVQVALVAGGMPCPRDSRMQEDVLGTTVPNGLDSLRRGDLVFWKGHVAIARDSTTILHANSFHVAVAIEPLADAISRIRAGGYEVTSVRRL
jgi:cell wall-associated NlpC family hydrolase